MILNIIIYIIIFEFYLTIKYIDSNNVRLMDVLLFLILAFVLIRLVGAFTYLDLRPLAESFNPPGPCPF